MGSTVVEKYELYGFHPSQEQADQIGSFASGGLFDEPEPLLILLEKAYDKKDGYTNSKWTVAFMGTMANFQENYLPGVGSCYDGGIAQHESIHTTEQLRLHMGRLAMSMQRPSLEALKARGVEFFDWDSSVEAHLPKDKTLARFPFCSEQRVGFFLKDDADIEAAVVANVQIQQSGPQENGGPGNAYFRPWMKTETTARFNIDHPFKPKVIQPYQPPASAAGSEVDSTNTESFSPN